MNFYFVQHRLTLFFVCMAFFLSKALFEWKLVLYPAKYRHYPVDVHLARNSPLNRHGRFHISLIWNAITMGMSRLRKFNFVSCPISGDAIRKLGGSRTQPFEKNRCADFRVKDALFEVIVEICCITKFFRIQGGNLTCLSVDKQGWSTQIFSCFFV